MCTRPANDRRRYILTSSLIGWAHKLNDPCTRYSSTSVLNNVVGYFYSSSAHWKSRVVMMPTLSPLVTPELVIMICYVATNWHTELASWRLTFLWNHRPITITSIMLFFRAEFKLFYHVKMKCYSMYAMTINWVLSIIFVHNVIIVNKNCIYIELVLLIVL